jgi:hypothetical protein
MEANEALKIKRTRIILLLALSQIGIKKLKSQIAWAKKLKGYPVIEISLN